MRWNGQNYSETMLKAARYLLFLEMRGSFEYAEMRKRNVESRFSASTFAALVTRGVVSPVQYDGAGYDVVRPHRLTFLGFMLVSHVGAESGFLADEIEFADKRALEIRRAEEIEEAKRDAAEVREIRLKAEREHNAAERAKYHPKPEPFVVDHEPEPTTPPPLPKRIPLPALEDMIPTSSESDAILSRIRDAMAAGRDISSSFEFKTSDEPDLCGYPLFPPYRCGREKNHERDKHEIVVSPWFPGLPFDQVTADAFASEPEMRNMARMVIESLKARAAGIDPSLDAQLADILNGVDPAAPSEDLAHELLATKSERAEAAFEVFRTAVDFLVPGHGEYCNHAHDYGTRVTFCTNIPVEMTNVLVIQGALVKVAENTEGEWIGLATSEADGFVYAMIYTADDDAAGSL